MEETEPSDTSTGAQEKIGLVDYGSDDDGEYHCSQGSNSSSDSGASIITETRPAPEEEDEFIMLDGVLMDRQLYLKEMGLLPPKPLVRLPQIVPPPPKVTAKRKKPREAVARTLEPPPPPEDLDMVDLDCYDQPIIPPPPEDLDIVDLDCYDQPIIPPPPEDLDMVDVDRYDEPIIPPALADQPIIPPALADEAAVEQLLEEIPEDLTDAQEFSKIYSKLIEKCQKLELTGGEDYFHALMDKCLNVSQSLFDRMTTGVCEEPRGPAAAIGGGDMYLHYLLTKVCSEAMKNRVQNIGNSASHFDLDQFLNQLRRENSDRDGYYSDSMAVAKINRETATGMKSTHPLVFLLGTMPDPEEEAAKRAAKKAACKRPPPPPDFGEPEPPDMAVALVSSSAPTAGNLTKELSKVLQEAYIQHRRPMSIFEFTLERASFARTVENLFYTSFAVKDGLVQITKDGAHFTDCALMVKPAKGEPLKTSGPDEENQVRNQNHRQKYILRFSPAMFRQMCMVSQGDEYMAEFRENFLPKPKDPNPKEQPKPKAIKGKGRKPKGRKAKQAK